MSALSAQYITIITAVILASMVAAALLYHARLPRPVNGIPVSEIRKPDYILAVILILFFSQAPLTAILQTGESSGTFSVFGLIAAYIIQLAILIPVAWRLKTITPASFSFPKNLRQIAFILNCGLGAIAVTVIASYALSWTGADEYIMNMTDCSPIQDSVEALQTASWVIKGAIIFGAIFIAPFVEEFCFRGLVYPVLKRCAGTIFAAVSTAFFFGIIHMSLVQFIPLSLFGLLLVVTYEATKTIWAPVFTHMVFNAFMVSNIIFLGL